MTYGQMMGTLFLPRRSPARCFSWSGSTFPRRRGTTGWCSASNTGHSRSPDTQPPPRVGPRRRGVPQRRVHLEQLERGAHSRVCGAHAADTRHWACPLACSTQVARQVASVPDEAPVRRYVCSYAYANAYGDHDDDDIDVVFDRTSTQRCVLTIHCTNTTQHGTQMLRNVVGFVCCTTVGLRR